MTAPDRKETAHHPSSREAPYGMTLQLQVGNTEAARHFYGTIFDGEPEYEPHDDFLEWRVAPGGETWIQAVCVTGEVRPLLNRIRFGVTDIAGMHAVIAQMGVDASPISTLPGVVRFFDFNDPWGNHLGYYEDLVSSGEQPIVGGSVHDESLFVTERADVFMQPDTSGRFQP